MDAILIAMMAWKPDASFTNCVPPRWKINELVFGIFDGHGQVPTKGLLATQRFALEAIFVYQLALTSPL
jgi:hypothetical protein